MDIFIAILDSFVQFITDLTAPFVDHVPTDTVDCSQWTPTDVWPDGSPVDHPQQCGVEHWGPAA